MSDSPFSSLGLEEALTKNDTGPIFKGIQILKARLAQVKSSPPGPEANKDEWAKYTGVVAALEASIAVLSRRRIDHEFDQESTL